MQRLILTIISIGITLNGFISPAFSLDPANWDKIRSSNDLRSYEQTKLRYQEQLEGYEYPAVFAALQKELETSVVWGTRDSKVYQNLATAFRHHNTVFANFNSELADIQQEAAVDSFLSKYSTGIFQFRCPDDRCFTGLPFEVKYEDLMALDDAKATDFLYRVETVARLTADFSKIQRAAFVKAVRNAAKRWELFLREGKSQYPWEALFNGWVIGTPSIQFPPERQWTLAHPLLGVELYTRSASDLKAKESLAIEVIGHTWYSWKSRDNPQEGLRWGGVAAVATFRDDRGPGVGIMAHYGRFFNLGVTWHEKDGTWFDSSPYILMGIDLFRFADYKADYLQDTWNKLPAFVRGMAR